MRHLKYLLMAAFVGMAFVACGDDDVVDSGGDDGGKKLGEKAWLSVSVVPARTRSLHDPDRETGKANESKINSLTIVLFDSFDLTTAVVTDVVTTNAVEGVATEPFEVSTSAVSVLAIVNNTTELPLSTSNVGQTYAQINRVIEEASVDVVTISSGSTRDNFMMTNASGQLEPQKDGAGANDPSEPATTDLVDKYLQTTESDARANALPIKVDRIAAKVRVFNKYAPPTGAPSTPADIKMKIEDFGWKLNVTNKKFFPVSERTWTQRELNKKSGSTVHPSPTWVWSDFWKFGSYRIDPNYDANTGTEQPTLANAAAATTDDTYKANYKFYVSYDGTNLTDSDGGVTEWNDESSGDESNPETPSNIKTEEYCLENTQIKTGNVYAYTTHALVKARVYPSHFIATNGTVGAEATATDFIKILNYYYNYSLLLDVIEIEMRNYQINAVLNPPTVTRTFNTYLAYLNGKGVAGVNEVNFDNIITTTSGTTDQNAAAVKAAFSGMGTAISTHGADVNGSVAYYKDAISYYTIMIKHDNVDADDFVNELGEFGVVRNAVYDIVINEVKAPGSPILPLPDPSEEDEDNQLLLSVKIEINPWTWYQQGVTLE